MTMGVSGVAGSWAPQAMSGASMQAPPAQKMASVFRQIDSANTGTIGKGQFLQTFQTMKPTAGFVAMGANAVFSALDPANSGSVSRQDFIQGMAKLMTQLRSSNASNS